MQQMIGSAGFVPPAPVPAHAVTNALLTEPAPGLFQQMLTDALLGPPTAPVQPVPLPLTPQGVPHLAGRTVAGAPPPEVEVSSPQAAPVQEEPGPPAMPVPDALQVALVAATLQSQVLLTATPQTAPWHPVLVTQSRAAPQNLVPLEVRETPAGPLVERFVQQVVASSAKEGLQTQSPPPQTQLQSLTPPPTQIQPQVQDRPQPQPQMRASSAEGCNPAPTFSDLVNLVMNAGQPETHTAPQFPVREFTPGGPVPALVEGPSEPEVPLVAEGRPQPLLTEAPTENAEPKESQRPPVNPDAVVRQVARSVKVLVDGKRSEIQLQLNPEHLGKVAVRLILNEGSVQANITARDASVRAALESGLEQLKVRFAEQGLKVEHVQVSVGSDSGFTQSQQSPQDHPRQPGQQAGRHQHWRARQEADQHQEETDNQKASPRMLGYGRTGSRINSLA